jgi:hypothetical protein
MTIVQIRSAAALPEQPFGLTRRGLPAKAEALE